MGKASRTKQEPDRRARIAAQREAQRRAEQRRRIYLAGGSILVVVIVVVAFVLVKLNSGGTTANGSNGPTGTALTQLTNEMTSIPTSVSDKVGAGSVTNKTFVPGTQIAAASSDIGSYVATIDAKPLTENGKPEILYEGAEYCPYCAAERWAMIAALSRFGTFSGLTTIHSSSTDVYPNTPTWTFYGSTYTSKYIAFTSVEETTEVSSVTLQTPTAAQQALAEAYDPGTGNGGAIPFIDVANKYAEVGNIQPYGPEDLSGKSWSEVAADFANPSTTIGKDGMGNANYLTAMICSADGNVPASACTPTIQGLEKNFASAS